MTFCASNIICTLQVTLSGGLRQFSASGASILFLETLGYERGEVQGLSFARLGSTMLLLKDSLEVDALCQDIRPSLEVLPPPKAKPQTPITWSTPIDDYAFCGAVPMEKVTHGGFKTMVIDSSLRWMLLLPLARIQLHSPCV